MGWWEKFFIPFLPIVSVVRNTMLATVLADFAICKIEVAGILSPRLVKKIKIK